LFNLQVWWVVAKNACHDEMEKRIVPWAELLESVVVVVVAGGARVRKEDARFLTGDTGAKGSSQAKRKKK
jgi:hypothetical protein